ncbi:MAG: hypothetical protein O6762_03660 [Thaumarchaeota archaeon]|nr:hypothetical protein [Nitrososphaerota archaeon]
MPSSAGTNDLLPQMGHIDAVFLTLLCLAIPADIAVNYNVRICILLSRVDKCF